MDMDFDMVMVMVMDKPFIHCPTEIDHLPPCLVVYFLQNVLLCLLNWYFVLYL